jgi:hypothetical protein
VLISLSDESVGLENTAAVGINRAALSKSRVKQSGVSGAKMSTTTRRVVHARRSTLRPGKFRPYRISKVFDKDFKPTFT